MDYDPILIAGVVVGLWEFCRPALRRIILAGLVFLAILGQYSAMRVYLKAKPLYRRFESTAPFYASPAVAAEWAQILQSSLHAKVLVLSWGNGIGLYFPTVETADSLFLLPVYVNRTVEDKLLEQIRAADVVAEELGEDTRRIDRDPEVQGALAGFRYREVGENFRTWRREERK